MELTLYRTAYSQRYFDHPIIEEESMVVEKFKEVRRIKKKGSIELLVSVNDAGCFIIDKTISEHDYAYYRVRKIKAVIAMMLLRVAE